MISVDKRVNVRSGNSDKSSLTRGILSSASKEPDLCLGLLEVFVSNPELDIKSPLIEFSADEDW